MGKEKRSSPTLKFNPGGSLSGWTSVGVSSFRGLKSTAAVRELIQNSLDAADAAKVTPAHIRFQISQCPVNDIPAINAYHEAFSDAQATQRKLSNDKLPNNAKAVADEIERCLREETCEVLYVLDNGIGLNKKKMNALLADGISDKDQPGATGSFGNGHVAVFPASDLRYVLYGGLSDEGMICSGHTILVSRRDKKVKASFDKDGYFVNKLNSDDLFDRYVFPQGEEIPPLISEKLKWIKGRWGTGSVVAVMGFNRFRESDVDIREQVFQAAACNFFEAIHSGSLIVDVERDGEVDSLDKDNLHVVLEGYRNQKRSKDFPSGSRAYEALLTLEKGKWVAAATDMGNVEIVYRCPIEGGTRVELCRNGMWVTDSLPGFQGKFGDLQPFHCVLPLRKNLNVKSLVCKAENPLHNSLSMKLMDKKDRAQLRRVLKAIWEKLREKIPKLKMETFRLDGILDVSTEEGFAQGGKGRPSMMGTLTRIKRPKSPEGIGEGGSLPGGGTRNGGVRGRRAGTFRRTGNRMQFQAVVVPTGLRSCRVFVPPGEKVPESEIRFALDESIDATSDSYSRESFVRLNSDTLRLNGEPVSPENLKKDDDGNVLGIMLGSFDKERDTLIEMDYTVPEGLPVKDDQQVVLKIEMIRRVSRKKVAGG